MEEFIRNIHGRLVECLEKILSKCSENTWWSSLKISLKTFLNEYLKKCLTEFMYELPKELLKKFWKVFFFEKLQEKYFEELFKHSFRRNPWRLWEIANVILEKNIFSWRKSQILGWFFEETHYERKNYWGIAEEIFWENFRRKSWRALLFPQETARGIQGKVPEKMLGGISGK